MPSIFVSYRREDSAGYAGRVCDLLDGEFGAGEVFVDVEDIAPGQDFVQVIESRMSACGVAIVVIGTRWLEVLRARAASGEDFVCQEVATAIERGVTVIPVLVGGAAMPGSRDLPEKIAALGRRQALQLHDDRFEDDMRILVRTIRSMPGWDNDLNGSWVTDMQKDGQPAYRLRLDLRTDGDKLLGTAFFPAGESDIRDGILTGSKASFSCVNPDLSSEPALFLFYSEIVDGELHLISVDGAGVGKGVARKVGRSLGA